MDFSVGLFEHLFSSPLKVLPLFDHALLRLLRTLCKASEDSDQLVSHKINFFMAFVIIFQMLLILRIFQVLKENVHVRISSISGYPELTRSTVPLSSDVGKLISFTGQFCLFNRYIFL